MSEEVKLVTLSKENASFMRELILIANKRNLFSRIELQVCQKVLDETNLSEDDSELNLKPDTVKDGLELVQCCIQRTPGYSRWEMEYVNKLFSAFQKPVIEEEEK